MPSAADKWDAIFAQQSCEHVFAAEVLQQNSHLLPESGVALDLACGLGGNAILLAQHGLNVYALDISYTALSKVDEYAQRHHLDIKTKQHDVELNPLPVEGYDVVVVSNFLCRPSVKNIRDSLKVDGLLFYQTFTREKAIQTGPTNPDYLLNKNELLSMCKGMDILVYREEGVQGNLDQGWRNQAMIVAQRRV